MGAGVSAGESNDDLVDNLMDADYIKSPVVERVFRAVDRGEYFILTDPSVNPYRDVAWKQGNLHISAPCIYSEVMEGLKLKSGQSFLNLGSGTGYFSTMAGLLLGGNGVNHGIELHEDVVAYATQKLEEFKRKSGAMDEYDFCEPKFMVGNCLSIACSGQLYDRVYCGAGCPEGYLSCLKGLVKVGGILIVPVNDQLTEMRRLSETNWGNKSLLPVSFASLLPPEDGEVDTVTLIPLQPLTLQEQCRITVRNILRHLIETDHPSVKTSSKSKWATGSGSGHNNSNNNNNNNGNNKKKRHLRKTLCSRKTNNAEKNGHKEIFDYFVLNVTKHRRQRRQQQQQQQEIAETSNEEVEVEPVTESEEEEDDISSHNGDPLDRMHDVFMDILSKFGRGSSTSSEVENRTSSNTQVTVAQVNHSKEDTVKTGSGNSNNSKDEGVDDTEMVAEEASTSNGDAKAGKSPPRSTRSKFDSGLGDDEDLISEIPQPMDMMDIVEAVSTSEEEYDDDDDQLKAGSKSAKGYGKRSRPKWNKFVRQQQEQQPHPNEDNDRDSSDMDERVQFRVTGYASPYSGYMAEKIQSLPLPSILKKYLHYYRQF